MQVAPPQIAAQVSHRPYSIPDRRWALKMTWHDLAFLHWPVSVESLRPFIPQRLAIQTHSGSAWIGVIPFHMSGIRLRRWPVIATTGRFPEINVRTYVTDGEHPGVWFFSLDATSRIAVAAARRWFGLNYIHARIAVQPGGPSVRYVHGRPRGDAAFEADYHPTGAPFTASPGSLEHFLCERYCLYAGGFGRRLVRGDIHHAPWQLQNCEADISVNRMLEPLGLTSSVSPVHMLFSQRIETVAWAPVAVQ